MSSQTDRVSVATPRSPNDHARYMGLRLTANEQLRTSQSVRSTVTPARDADATAHVPRATALATTGQPATLAVRLPIGRRRGAITWRIPAAPSAIRCVSGSGAFFHHRGRCTLGVLSRPPSTVIAEPFVDL